MRSEGAQRHLVDAAATSLGIFAIAATSAVEVLVFLHKYGTNDTTDGVFAAFALYSVVTVFAQNLRTSAVPLITGRAAVMRPGDFTVAIATLVAIVGVGCLVTARPLAEALGGSLDRAGVDAATTSLRILGPAMGLQLLAAGLAVLGARRGRLRAVGIGYVAANVIGLAAFFALAPIAEEQALAWCVLATSVALVPLLVPAAGGLETGNRVVRASALIVRSAAIPEAYVVLYPITIALAGDVAAGQISQFAVAFTVCSYLPGLTSIALGMTDVARLSGAAISTVDRAKVSRRSARWSAALVAPVLGIAALAGSAVFSGLTSDSTGEVIDFGWLFVLLAPWVAATILLWSTLPTLLAVTRGEGLVRYVPVVIAVHVVATVVGRAVDGFNGVVIAMAVAPFAGAVAAWAMTGVLKYAPAILRDVALTAVIAVAVFAPVAIVTQ